MQPFSTVAPAIGNQNDRALLWKQWSMEILVLNIWPCQEDPASMIHPGARESPPGFLPPCWSTYQNQTPCLHPAVAWPDWWRENEEQRTPEVLQGRGSATWSDRYFPGDPGLWLVSHEDTQLWLVSRSVPVSLWLPRSWRCLRASTLPLRTSSYRPA